MNAKTQFCAHTMMRMFDITVSHGVMEKELIQGFESNEWVTRLFMSAGFVFNYQFLLRGIIQPEQS